MARPLKVASGFFLLYALTMASIELAPSPENSCHTVSALPLLAAPPLPLLRPQPVSATAEPARTASDVRTRLRRADVVVTTSSPIWMIRRIAGLPGVPGRDRSGCHRILAEAPAEIPPARKVYSHVPFAPSARGRFG